MTLHTPLNDLLGNINIDKRKMNVIYTFFNMERIKSSGNLQGPYIWKSIENEGEVFACISRSEKIRQEIIRLVRPHYLPGSLLKWITNDDRQCCWISKKLPPIVHEIFSNIPTWISDRDRIVTAIDYWDEILEKKENTIRRIEDNWRSQLTKDARFEPLKGKHEVEKRAFILKWLSENIPTRWGYVDAFTSHTDMLIHFDSFFLRDDQIEKAIRSTQDAFTQRQYRDKLEKSGKKQFNFVFSKETNTQLDSLAHQYNMSRTQVLAHLIRMETEMNQYLTNSERSPQL